MAPKRKVFAAQKPKLGGSPVEVSEVGFTNLGLLRSKNLVDRSIAIAQRAAIALRKCRAHFTDDAEGDLFGGFSAEVETDRSVKPSKLVGCNSVTLSLEVLENFSRTFFWPE
jgi:hypothetical protein